MITNLCHFCAGNQWCRSETLVLWWAVTGSNRRPSRCKRTIPTDFSHEIAPVPRERARNDSRNFKRSCADTVPARQEDSVRINPALSRQIAATKRELRRARRGQPAGV
jgi:hypothetical protein